MSQAVSAAQMREIDRWAIEVIGIPALCLMENAGRMVAEEARKILKRRPGEVVVVCGSGNNGGDGLAAVRHLKNSGAAVTIVMAAERSRLSEEALIHYLVAGHLGIPVLSADRKGLAALRRAVLIIDALLGVGLARDVAGALGRVIDTVNASRAVVLAVDVPSGLDATTGCVRGKAVKADVTVTLARAKTGLYLTDGPRHAGKVRIVDIGMPGGYVKQ
jgi:ADP-dependent NAD(P)H-hydrate dehydratase / NAD(P)H-hydrate epimerase